MPSTNRAGGVRVVTAGHINWDVTLRVDALPEPDGEARISSQQRSGGGSAANVAVALSRMDVSTGLVGSVGSDDNGLLVQRELTSAGVDCTHVLEVAGIETTTKYLIVDESGEVMVLGNEGANETIAPDDIEPGYVRAADHLHLTSQRPDTAAELARIATEAGVTVSFDPGRRLAERDFSRALAYSDIVFLNDREAATILDRDLEHPSSELHGRVVVIKHGRNGARVDTTKGVYTHPGFGVESVDSTGAGDAFAAGFITTLLDSADYERALEFANACGALTSMAAGARTSPTRADVEAFFDERF
ncbi:MULTISPECIES: carbohydrate kinase family protein [unclassified Haladaptatus]|uniref:carbohydrate kinase family protein n=1 Tax=unclassified Haladaptatus TaxID=2622732 RepID=UPI00209BDCB5|nr:MULTISPECIES: carbohydrate kinase family protein [unclassified Haladaptatus]MCO8243249.1 carbohydrate kinase family protein [Haladaptatus sp. AB643]MCO8252960.1 carbohydrate kinase family protein [Haladaptatus sp. AB618]